MRIAKLASLGILAAASAFTATNAAHAAALITDANGVQISSGGTFTEFHAVPDRGFGITVGDDGTANVASFVNAAEIREISPDGTTSSVMAAGSFWGLQNDGSGGLYASSSVDLGGSDAVFHYDAAGNQIGSFATLAGAVRGITADENSIYVVSAHQNFAVTSYDLAGNHLTTYAGPSYDAQDAVYHDGSVYVAFNGNSSVYALDPATGVYTYLLTAPGGIRGLSFGPDGNLYVVSHGDDVFGSPLPGTSSVFYYSTDGTTGGTTALGTYVSGLTGAVDIAFQPIPEPTSLAMLAIGSVLLLRRRRGA